MNGWRCMNCGATSELATKIEGVARSCMSCGYLGGMQPFDCSPVKAHKNMPKTHKPVLDRKSVV